MFKLILIISSLHSYAIADVNGGDYNTSGGAYFSSSELCGKVGEQWKDGHTNYDYVCLNVSGQ